MSDNKIFPLRLPAELRDQLELAASREDRSLTKEILRRLKDSFRQREEKAA